MEFTKFLLVDFLKRLIEFDKNCRSAIDKACCDIQNQEDAGKSELGKFRSDAEQKAKIYTSEVGTINFDFQKKVDELYAIDIKKKNEIFVRLQKCKEQLAIVSSAENSITDKSTYSSKIDNETVPVDISIEEILQGKIDFSAKSYEVNEVLNSSKKKDAVSICSTFHSLCRTAEKLLSQEIIALRGIIIQNRDALNSNYSSVGSEHHDRNVAEWEVMNEYFEEKFLRDFASQSGFNRKESERVNSSISNALKQHMDELVDEFCRRFSPHKFAEEYERIYKVEPSYAKYECCADMPRNVHISTLEYDIEPGSEKQTV